MTAFKYLPFFILFFSVSCRSPVTEYRINQDQIVSSGPVGDESDLTSEVASVNPTKELIVVGEQVLTDPALVGPGAPMHFVSLVRQMLPENATDLEVSQFIVDWFDEWATRSKVGEDTFSPRPGVRQVLCWWIEASGGGPDCKLPSHGLRLEFAPMKLLAIVNRMDLRKSGCDSGGEGRFVFGMLLAPTDRPWEAQRVRRATVIFEYNLPTDSKPGSANSVYSWAAKWHALGALPCDSKDCASYKATLVKLTSDFTSRNLTSGTPSGNALGQIRTNEIDFGDSWEFREFRLVKVNERHQLRQFNTIGTPLNALNRTKQLSDFINARRKQAGLNQLSFPDHMLAGAVRGNLKDRWFVGKAGPGVGLIDESERFAFAKSTCNGCHLTEFPRIKSIDQAFHISPSRSGLPKISPFLRNELATKRSAIFNAILSNKTCVGAGPNSMSLSGQTSGGRGDVGEGYVH